MSMCWRCNPTRIAAVFATALAVVAPAMPCTAQAPKELAPRDVPPPDIQDLTITQNLDEKLPLELTFIDDTGRSVTIGDYFNRGKPVIITPVFYRCINICTETLNGLTRALNEIDAVGGDDFLLLTYTINPREQYRLAEVKKSNYLELYQRETTDDAWHFLTGDEDNIKALSKAIGFGYRYQERTGDYAHAPCIVFCTPDGRISRYVNTIMPETDTVNKAILEASAGTVGSTWDHIVLWCYSYDPSRGEYVVAARKVMFLGGLVMMLIVALGLTFLWRRERRRRRSAFDEQGTPLAGLQS